jgi:hypothetical protein
MTACAKASFGHGRAAAEVQRHIRHAVEMFNPKLPPHYL